MQEQNEEVWETVGKIILLNMMEKPFCMLLSWLICAIPGTLVALWIHIHYLKKLAYCCAVARCCVTHRGLSFIGKKGGLIIHWNTTLSLITFSNWENNAQSVKTRPSIQWLQLHVNCTNHWIDGWVIADWALFSQLLEVIRDKVSHICDSLSPIFRQQKLGAYPKIP